MRTVAHWFRNDLRTADNPALYQASCQDARLLCFYCWCPQSMQAHDEGQAKQHMVKKALAGLTRKLAGLNIRLIILPSQTFHQSVEDILAAVAEYGIDTLYFNDEVPLNERRRDDHLCQLAAARGLKVVRCQDQSMLHPSTVSTLNGQAFQVFTAFKKASLSRLTVQRLQPCPQPEQKSIDNLSQIPAFNTVITDIDDPVNEEQARAALQAFVLNRLDSYHHNRDAPGLLATSKLSAYLACGMLSVRQCWLAARQLSETDAGQEVWLSQLLWRDFYRYIVWHDPEVCRGKPVKAWTDKVNWRRDHADFQRWCRGETGVPLVDAGMRQLRKSGWMHNRVRMVCASFLTKNLLIDWRWGERFFMQNLADADFANNNGGWQWVASVGCDAAPYFRVFNPFRQSLRFDYDGDYIRHWVPELAEVQVTHLHKPGAIGKHYAHISYPKPMVDLSLSRQAAIEAFKRAKS